jgi:hypothetical protein
MIDPMDARVANVRPIARERAMDAVPEDLAAGPLTSASIGRSGGRVDQCPA